MYARFPMLQPYKHYTENDCLNLKNSDPISIVRFELIWTLKSFSLHISKSKTAVHRCFLISIHLVLRLYVLLAGGGAHTVSPDSAASSAHSYIHSSRCYQSMLLFLVITTVVLYDFNYVGF